MSFILDALKKSETDRQRQSGPSLFEVKVAAPRRRLPIWAVAIAVLLGINLIVVSWMLLRRPSPQQSAATSSAAAAPAGHTPNPDSASLSAAGIAPAGSAATGPAAGAAQRAPGSAASPPSPLSSESPSPPAAAPPAASSGTPRAGATPAGAAPAADQSANPPAAGDPSDYAPAVEPAGARGSGAPAGAPAGGLPLYQQIVDSAGLPSLHLDLHVFADRPRDRFVMINMHRLGEGDSLPEGVQVETIRPDGVVLAYHGTRFLLPRN
jgi:general secretion pathway protein B